MISYPEFLAQVNANDLAMMTAFLRGERVTTTVAAEADTMLAAATRLFQAELVWRVVRGYEMKGGVLEHQFDGYVSPVGAGYLAQCARERIILSRLPLP